MRLVAANYNVVSSYDLVRALTQEYTLPRRALILTFDDGYRCFAETAMPVLRRLGLPVTLFVATTLTGSPAGLFWWDTLYRALSATLMPALEVPGVGVLPLGSPGERLAAYERLVGMIEREEWDTRRPPALLDRVLERCAVEPNEGRYLLNWDELGALSAEGVAVGPHTRSHPVLARLTPEQVRAEVSGSWADVQAHIARPLPIFCYPNGKPHALNRSSVEAVRQVRELAGAYTMVAGLNVLGTTDPYLMPRVGMQAGQTLRRFRFKLSAAGRLYRQLKALARPSHAEKIRL